MESGSYRTLRGESGPGVKIMQKKRARVKIVWIWGENYSNPLFFTEIFIPGPRENSARSAEAISNPAAIKQFHKVMKTELEPNCCK